VGEPAPTFSTSDLEGNRVTLVDHRGQVVLLNFWASWCAPCREEFPKLKAVHGRDDVVVLGVVFDDSKRKAAGFMREQGATWPGLVDPDHDIADAYGVFKKPGIPVTWAIDADGVARARRLGPLTDAALTDLLARAH
jgi:cytochrome c biogenesis protein CcmG/thiol:disulfide interchange protein DsbE